MTFLADTFRDLANDPDTWPGENAKWPWNATLITARLALMVVEAEICTSGTLALDNLGINPSHYAKVRKRVEADTESQKEVTNNDKAKRLGR